MQIGNHVTVVPQDSLAACGHFYVGGQWDQNESGEKHFLRNQALVEVYVPKKVTHPYPLIFFYGSAQTILNWEQTPDGRMGWRDYFLKEGYIVYLVEQPARGRSPYHA
jgi:hypothetical protein